MHWQHPLKQQQPQQQLLQGRWQRRQLTSAVKEAAKYQTRETATTGSRPHQRTSRRPSPLTGAASPTGARQVRASTTCASSCTSAQQRGSGILTGLC